MRWRSWIWLGAGLLLFAVFWRLGPSASLEQTDHFHALPMSPPAESHLNTALVARPGPRPEFPFRLANTTESFSTLLRKDRAILLENAIFDTEATLSLPIPESLRVDGDPGAYIVQSKDDLDGTFGESIRAAGAAIVSYIPNRALLVRASTAVAQELRTRDRVQAVIVYQPYFKLKPSLLSLVLNESVKDTWQSQAPGTAELELNVLIFPSALEEARAGLAGLHTRVLGEGSTPFGPVLTVRGPLSSVASLARLPAVQMLELSRIRRVAMDLGREASGIAGSSTAMWNYLGLTGTNVTVSVLDTGIDPVHPDLKGRVLFEDPAGGADPSGHGTHIAGVIAGNGASSMNVANAPGSSVPPVSFQFRGAAPAASLFSIPFGSNNAPQQLSVALQQSSTKGSIVNNSWGYSDDYDYDLAAVICDAAARDVSPSVPGPQPVLCVFAAGNDGDGSDNGMGGKPGSVQSPAVAKNVITVGALEKNRWITNETWTCSGDGSCQTNAPWLLSTDSTNQVACFSSRGNVGAGIEGSSGRCKPDLVAQGTFTIAARSSNWDKSAYYSATNSVFTRLTDANYGQVLSNLNESVGPIYRFESGTSVAAAEVSGGLALMQEFFARLGRTNSPAGMKALLINGARPVGAYAVGPGASTNYQGWGQFHLPTSIHKALTNQAAAGSSMFFYDQDPATALASGESLTRSFDVRYAARSLPLRVTLVWTDPPGNPVAAVKLVNDLDLVVTNLDTGEVYWGNDFPSGGRFSRRWEAGSESCHDVVNNVESVLLPGSLSGHYSVTVAGRAVHVNAVESSVAKIAQDYALVVSCGDGQVPDALSVEQVATVEASAVAAVTVLTNQFSTSSGDFGAVLWHERLGAGSPLLSSNSIPLGSSGTSLLAPGTSNQWHFYILTNSSLFTNAAVVTFLPPTLSPRGGQNDPTEQADIDLYVSGDPGLLALSPAAIVDAAKSIGRNGSESIVLSNVTAEVLFIAVKCESQTAADYGFMAVLSDSPFASTDSQGMTILRGFPSPAVIPGPGTTAMMCLASDPILTRRVFVTNSVLHAETRDLKGSLTHDNSTVVLNNFGTNAGQDFVYDDSGEGTIAGARTSDGPGSLASFGGSQGMGQWLLTTQSTNLFGTNALFSVGLEPQTDLAGGVGSSLAPGGCRSDFIGIAPGISNLMAMVTVVSGTGPILMQLLPVANDATNSPVLLVNGGEHGALSIDATASPPIHAGTYEVRLCNQGPDPAEFTLLCTTVVDQRPRPVFGYELSQPVALPDRAVTSSVISVTNLEYIESVDVGVRIEHPRISDLVLHLVSPSGQRVLLQENRGGASAEGEGGDTIMTNSTAVSWTGGPQAFTNMFETGQRSGSVSIDYDMYSLPDTMHVYYQDVLLFDSGLVSGPGTTNLTYGPGTATSIAIVMNQGGNPDTNTAWRYRVTSTRPVPVPLTFTENTNFASVPIKFAPQPLTNINYSVPGSSPPVGIFYLPEQSLDALVGESALGDWKLEIEDTRAGPPNAEPRLITWRINFHLQNTFPVPGGLTPGKAFTSLLGPNQVLWYYIDALSWASFATNRLISASMPVNFLFASTPPTAGTNASAVPLMLSSTAGSVVLQTNGVPPLVPGARYYLGLQNTNYSTVTCSLQVDFDVNDVIALENGAPLQASNQGPLKPMDYYSFIVSTNAARVQFEVNRPTENLTLFVHRGMPLPGPVWADFSSANAWTNDELIVIYDFSQPIPLTPGLWYISVLNSSPNPAEYTVLATEFPAYATNVVITESVVMNDSICVSWTSLPGVHYFVQAKGRLDDADWTTVSPTLTASDVLTSYCTPANAGFQYFRVCEGLVLTQPPLLISSVSWSPAGAILQWSAEPGRRFKVEWSPAIAPPEWSAFTNVISSADGEFRFVDDGSQSGGLGAARFYRLQSGL